MICRFRFTRWLALVTALIAAPSTVDASTVLVPLSDADLVRTSALIVVGTTLKIESLALRDGRVLTEITLRVERTLKGRPTGTKVVVTAPGGRAGDRTVRIHGAPEFTLGEKALVFLRRGRGGRLHTNALALGKYRVEARPGARSLAWRTVPDVDARDLDGFLAEIDALAATEPQERVPTGHVTIDPAMVVGRAVTDRFTFLGGSPFRWFQSVVTFGLANADAALGQTSTQAVVDGAAAAWTNVASASLVLQRGPGTPAGSVAGDLCNGTSTIQFNDPFEEVDDLVGCSGVLAVGGFCGSGQTMVVNGTTFERITEGDVTMNDGVGACWGSTNVAEIVTHEFGHAIGLGHSGDSNATMYAYAHFDGRGAALRADDIAGVSFLYPVASATTTTTPTTSSSTSSSRSTTTSTSRTTTSTSRTTTSTSSTRTTSTRSSTSTVRTTTTSSTTVAGSPAADEDEDGVPDAADGCPSTPGGDLVGIDGCSSCPCDASPDGTPWESRREYLTCVRAEAKAQLAAGWLDPAAERFALRAARLSSCGRADRTRCCHYGVEDASGLRSAKCRVTALWSCTPRSPRVEWTEDVGPGSCILNPCE